MDAWVKRTFPAGWLTSPCIRTPLSLYTCGTLYGLRSLWLEKKSWGTQVTRGKLWGPNWLSSLFETCFPISFIFLKAKDSIHLQAIAWRWHAWAGIWGVPSWEWLLGLDKLCVQQGWSMGSANLGLAPLPPAPPRILEFFLTACISPQLTQFG